MIPVQCITCKLYAGALKCKAFPDGIPAPILTGAVSHDKRYLGDKGILRQPEPGAKGLADE